MTKNEFLKNDRKGKYIYQNARVDKIDVVADRIRGGYCVMVEFECDETQNGTFGYKPSTVSLRLNFGSIGEFLDVFAEYGNGIDSIKIFDKTYDSLSSIVGKYVRLCIYEVPDEEMHQLSDKYELVAVRNILANRESQTFLVDQ